MTDLDREQLKRDCADALEVLTRDQRVDRIAELADSLRTLGAPYRFHGELMHGALRDGQNNAIVWHLIHVLEKLEKEVAWKEDAPRRAMNTPRASPFSREESSDGTTILPRPYTSRRCSESSVAAELISAIAAGLHAVPVAWATGMGRIVASALVALTLAGFVSPPEPRAGRRLNATAIENERQGSTAWEIISPALAREIEGYASRTSVNRGETIDLLVSSVESAYTIEVFRMGWYGGAGARQVAGPISRAGIKQATPPPDPRTGLVACRWRDPYRLATRDGSAPWPSGVYLARLTARPSRRQAYIVFVVRDDARPSDLVFQSSVTTFAAYNNWGGKSLYAFNSVGGPARKVSFDRPYAMAPYGIRLDGAGDFLRRWEYNALRWLEREGYDVTYITDVDTHERAHTLLEHRVFLSVGHDEYWSWAMRDHVEAARDQGVNLAFLGANASFWQIRFEPGVVGAPNRTIVGYKDAARQDDPYATDDDPTNDHLVTGRWREPPVSRPEASMIGVMYVADPVDADIVVADASHWAFAGTGLANGDVMAGLLGYEVDAAPTDARPDLVRLAHSPFIAHNPPRTLHSHMTIYTSGGGAVVFATGSMQWNWGLDGYNTPWFHPLRVNAAAQQVTHNVLRRMLTGANRK